MTQTQKDIIAGAKWEAAQHREARRRLLQMAQGEPNLVQRLRYKCEAGERLLLAKQADQRAALARVVV